MSLPTRIRGIKQPNWTDILRWTTVTDGWMMAEVDHDWRIWSDPYGTACTVRHKGEPKTHYFDTLIKGLAFLDYRPDA